MLTFSTLSFISLLIIISCSEESDKALTIWRNVFKKKRVDQLETAGNLLFIGDSKKQYQTLALLTDASKKVLDDAKIFLELSEFRPGQPFPLDVQVQEHLSRLMENTAFICEISLRLPLIMGKFFKQDDDFTRLMSFTANLAVESGFFDEKTLEMMDACRQEMYLSPRRPGFRNPYAEQALREKYEREMAISAEKQRKEKQKKTIKRQKSPRLSGRTEF